MDFFLLSLNINERQNIPIKEEPENGVEPERHDSDQSSQKFKVKQANENFGQDVEPGDNTTSLNKNLPKKESSNEERNGKSDQSEKNKDRF